VVSFHTHRWQQFWRRRCPTLVINGPLGLPSCPAQPEWKKASERCIDEPVTAGSGGHRQAIPPPNSLGSKS